MKTAVLVDGTRTPLLKAGTVPGLTAVELGSAAVRGLQARLPLPFSDLAEEAVGANIGNQVLAPDGSNVTRLITLNVGLPLGITARTVNINCASGLHAALDAAKDIELGLVKGALVIGVEVMSDYIAVYRREQREAFAALAMAGRSKDPAVKKMVNQLKLLAKIKTTPHDPIWMVSAGLTDPSCDMRMDKISDHIAKTWGISRQEQDLFAMESQRRAARAQASGRLAKEITPFSRDARFGVWYKDNGVRPDTTLEKLSRLKPIYPEGTVTPGNASQITDGAVALLLMEEEYAKSLGLKARAIIASRNSGAYGCEPTMMGLGPVGAVKQVLDRTGLSLKDFSVIEAHEAFATVVLAQSRAFASKEYCAKLGLGEPMGELAFEVTNVNGGAVALGHPLAASGARLLLTCVQELEERNQETGLVALCAAGGLGEALAIQRRKP